MLADINILYLHETFINFLGEDINIELFLTKKVLRAMKFLENLINLVPRAPISLMYLRYKC